MAFITQNVDVVNAGAASCDAVFNFGLTVTQRLGTLSGLCWLAVQLAQVSAQHDSWWLYCAGGATTVQPGFASALSSGMRLRDTRETAWYSHITLLLTEVLQCVAVRTADGFNQLHYYTIVQ